MNNIEELDCSNKEDAKKFIELYDKKKEKHKEKYGFIGKNFKPFSVIKQELTSKYKQARITLQMEYWQMEYNDAKRLHRSLTKERWEHGRIKNLSEGNL